MIDWAQESTYRISALVGGLGRLDALALLEMPEQLDVLAHELADAMAYQFTHVPVPNKAGRWSHDRTGTDNDPSDWNDAYVHSIDTITVHESYGTPVARVTMEGGGVWVWTGWRSHPIVADEAEYLHFKGSEGWARVTEVESPAYTRDPFVERAIDSLHMVKPLQSILDRVTASTGLQISSAFVGAA